MDKKNYGSGNSINHLIEIENELEIIASRKK